MISNLQVRRARFDSTRMTDLNHWTKNLAIKPEIFQPADRVLFASKTGSMNLSGNILEGIFGLGKTKYIDDLNWSWKMKAVGYRPITIMENRTKLNRDTPGKNRRPIVVLVDADLGAIGETWSPGSSDKSQVAIIKSKRKEGRAYEYVLQTYTESSAHYIRKEYLEPGTKWTRFYTMRGEAAESGGHTERSTDIEYNNRLVKLRKQYKVTDFAAQAVLEIAFESNGKVHSSWMDMQEAEYRMAMNKEVAMHAMYSRIGDTPLIDPDSGYPINPGAGIQQQIGWGGNVEAYTTLSPELVEAFIARMVYSRISPGDLGEVIGWSGYYGMQEFSKALDKWSGGKAVVRESNMFYSKDSKGVHNNSLRAGYQFTVYDLPNGGSFRLIHNPMNDDKSIHRDIDPLTGYPLESQRITILDVTGGNGHSINSKDNICLVRKNKVYGVTLTEGRVGPGGVSTGNNAKHSGDYYRVDISDSIGAQITDPTVTGELVKRVNK